MLKDVLAFANAWRDSDAYILIGVEEIRGGRSIVRGINKHLSDHELQQFINSKTQKPITFGYEGISINGMQVGVISIPLQERPFYTKNKFGKIEAGKIYLRRGSSTDVALPDEIAEMGKKLGRSAVATFEIVTVAGVRQAVSFPEIWLEVSLLNRGNATAYDVQVNTKSYSRANFEINHTRWKDKSVPYPERAQSSLEPLHQGDTMHIFSWPLGIVQPDTDQLIKLGYGQKVKFEKPVNYTGDDLKIELRIFARDLSPVTITISYRKDEIKNLASKTFRPGE